MPQQPKVDPNFTPDENFVPDDDFTPDAPTVEPESPHAGFLSSVYHALSDPLTDMPSRIGKSISSGMDSIPMIQPNGQGGFRDYLAGADARAKGFFQGGTEALGDLASGLTSPANIGMTLATGGSSLAAKAGLPEIASLLSYGGKALAVPGAIHGGSEIINPDATMTQRGQGVVELAGNLAGMSHSPHTVPDAKPNTVLPHEVPNTSAKPVPTDITPIEQTKPGFFDRMPREDTGSVVTPEKPKPTMQTAPMGQKIIIRKEGATPDVIKKAKEAGFEFDGLNDQGNFRFTKTTEPAVGPILESEVGEARPTTAGVKEQLGPLTDTKRSNPLVEAFNLPRGIMASMDFSAPLRQGIGLIHKPEFWTAVKPMMKAWASEDGFRASQNEIANRPLFRERAGPNGKVLPSFADDAGLKLTDLTDLSKREEAIMSTWAEKIPGVRRSNRAYTSFLNNLRADTFESLIKDGKVFGADAKANLPLARELANFVNTASGRGSLGSLEKAAVPLNTLFFSPRLIASRVQMMNPKYYIMASPQVRKEALKSLLAIAAAGNTVTQLGKMAGGTVSMDPTSSDFGKLKIGNTRIDPYGGFQQYIVAASRLMSGKVTSSTSGNEYDLNNPQGPYDPTHYDVLERFGRGKLHPVLGFAYSFLRGKKEMSGKPMDFTTSNPMENAVAQRFIPILLQDFYELAKTDELSPELKALVGTLSTFGMGTQTYDSQ